MPLDLNLELSLGGLALGPPSDSPPNKTPPNDVDLYWKVVMPWAYLSKRQDQ